MVKRKVAALDKVEADLVNLQQKMRRDPNSYTHEAYGHWDAYQAKKQLFLSSPTLASASEVEAFTELVELFAHVADCYRELTATLPDDLKAILTQHHAQLGPDLREKIVGSLVLLRRREVIDSTSLLTTLFPLLISTPSKTLRTSIFHRTITELREANSKSTNHRLNRTMTTVLHQLVASDPKSKDAIWAVKTIRELWRRQVWTESQQVEVMRAACLSDNERVVVGACRFFLGGDKEREEYEGESSDEEVDLKQVKHQIGINKKSRKAMKTYERAKEKVKRQEAKKNKPHPLNFSALHLLHDSQGFAEQLFSKHLQQTSSKMTVDSKLLVLQLVTRLVGLHRLIVVPLYSYFFKYLTPRQESVTTFLACLAQASHPLVTPDLLEPLIVKIANEFVSEAAASEVASAGLNAIREICVRQPLAMSDTLLQDLVDYRKSKDKGVMMAARGLLSLYRDVGAELLKKKDRGKEAAMGLRSGDLKQKKFGEEDVGGIEGLELLAKWKEEEKKRKQAENGEEEGAKGENDKKDGDDDEGFNSSDWEVDSDDSSDSGGWINVSDSEDEEPVNKRQKTDSEAPELVEEDKEDAEAESERLSKLATTTILTPADFAKLQELRLAANIDKAMGNRLKRQKELQARHADDPLTAEQIELPSKLRKTTKEERVAMAREGKPDREEHKSTQAIRKSKKEAAGKSTTNKEKARNKNIFMTLGKAKMKQKRSLVQTKKILQGHIARGKSGGRRRNGT